MNLSEFRQHGYAVIDWIADYLEKVESFPVKPLVEPGQIRASLPLHPPETGESFDAIFRDFQTLIVPGLTHWQSPNFFAYFPSNVSEPSILGELLSAGLGVQGMLWSTGPACTELESHVMDWLVDLLDLPQTFHSAGKGGGVIQDTASSAVLCALLAARGRATGFEVNRSGIVSPLTVYASTQAHSSIEKAVGIAGLGADHLRMIETDEKLAMRPESLEAALALDRREGRAPVFVCASVGTTSTLAVDPVRRIGEVCNKHGVWLHVDAAMAGPAAICPEFRWINDGVELADSYCFNPHKWMLTNFDCSAFFVADRSALIRTLSILPEYLRNQATERGNVIDYRDWQIQLGRRFRALKLWFVIRHYGAEGIRALIRKHVAIAREFADWVAADERFEIAAPAHLNLVCFRHRGGDRVNQIVMDSVNNSGRAFFSHTRVDGKLTLRLCVGQRHTERKHVAEAWKMIRDAASAVE